MAETEFLELRVNPLNDSGCLCMCVLWQIKEIMHINLYPSTLKMEVAYFSEILITTYKTTKHRNQEDYNNHLQKCENPKLQIISINFT
jgi:hypothetical protein